MGVLVLKKRLIVPVNCSYGQVSGKRRLNLKLEGERRSWLLVVGESGRE